MRNTQKKWKKLGEAQDRLAGVRRKAKLEMEWKRGRLLKRDLQINVGSGRIGKARCKKDLQKKEEVQYGEKEGVENIDESFEIVEGPEEGRNARNFRFSCCANSYGSNAVAWFNPEHIKSEDIKLAEEMYGDLCYCHPSPKAHMVVNQVVGTSMLDTGAEVNLVTRNFLEKSKGCMNNINKQEFPGDPPMITMADRRRKECLGYALLDLRIHGCSWGQPRQLFFVVDMLPPNIDMILGMPWIRITRLQIDCDASGRAIGTIWHENGLKNASWKACEEGGLGTVVSHEAAGASDDSENEEVYP